MPSNFQGTCQVCFRVQMIVRGNLSLHGYHIPFGQFEGICYGARYPAFEQDKARTKWYLGIVQDELGSIDASIARLIARPKRIMWSEKTHQYNSRTYKIEVITEKVEIERDAPAEVFKTPWGGENETVPSYARALSLMIVNLQGEKKMVTHLRDDLTQAIQGWTLKPLIHYVEKEPCQHEEKVYTPRPYDEAYELRRAEWNSDKKRSPQWFEVHCAECKTNLRSVHEEVE